MKILSKTTIITIALGLVLGAIPPAQARNAQGAFLTNTNSIDPTRPVHAHKYQDRTKKPMRLSDSVLIKQKCSSCGHKRILQRFSDGREGVFGNQ